MKFRPKQNQIKSQMKGYKILCSFNLWKINCIERIICCHQINMLRVIMKNLFFFFFLNEKKREIKSTLATNL